MKFCPRRFVILPTQYSDIWQKKALASFWAVQSKGFDIPERVSVKALPYLAQYLKHFNECSEINTNYNHLSKVRFLSLNHSLYYSILVQNLVHWEQLDKD